MHPPFVMNPRIDDTAQIGRSGCNRYLTPVGQNPIKSHTELYALDSYRDLGDLMAPDSGAPQAGDFITIFKTGSVDPEENPELADQLLDSRTQVTSETGYMMKFGDQSHSALTPFDIVTLPGQSYPVPTSALESLPPHVTATLEQDGAVQIVGEYDPDSGVYNDVTIAWEHRDDIDRIAELISSGDLSLHEAVDWVVIEEAERYTPAQWAAIRNVTEDAVRSNVSSAREQLLPEGADSPSP